MDEQIKFDALAESWQQQEVTNELNIEKLKSHLFIERAKQILISILEFLIIFAVAWSLYWNINNNGAAHLTVWLSFGLLAGGVVFVLSMKSRLTTFKTLERPTIQLIELQRTYSLQAIARANLAKYLAGAFLLAMCVSFGYEFNTQEELAFETFYRYAFGLVWIFLAWLIVNRQQRKLMRFLKRISGELK